MIRENSSLLRLSCLLIGFESGVGVLGALFIWLAYGADWGFGVAFSVQAAKDTLVYLLPLLLLAFFVTSRWALNQPALKQIHDFVQGSVVGRFLREAPIWVLFLAAVSAGVGEELLFRGAIHPWLGLWPTAIIFGFLHSVTRMYFFIAFGVGLYLGFCFEASGNNILVPIALHALYDFVAFLLYRRLEKVSDEDLQ